MKLRGRAKKITFHVWREEGTTTRAENRRRAAAKAALKRAQNKGHGAEDARNRKAAGSKLRGWEDF